MIVAKAPSKAILFGEHAVVYGKRGISATIAEGTKVKISSDPRGGFSSVYKGELFERNFKAVDYAYELFEKYYPYEEKKRDYKKISEMTFNDAIMVVYHNLSKKFGRKSVRIETEQNKNLKGLGGSAGTFAAFALGYAEFTGNAISKDEIINLSKIGDIIAHGGKASGIDINTVTRGGYLSYVKNKDPDEIDLSLGKSIVIVNSGEYANTNDMIKRVEKKKDEDEDRFSRIMDRLERITKKALVNLEKKDAASFGSLMYDYYSELRKFDISTKKLDEIVDIARENKALGAKPTGAWGGGNCIVLPRDESQSEELINIYKSKGYDAFSTELGVPGVSIEKGMKKYEI